MSDTKPTQISSFGSKYQFKPENAPKGAGTICMKDCPLVDTCVYSTKRLYIDHPDRWAFYVWDALEDIENPTIDDKIALLRKVTAHMQDVAYKCDNNVVDHQSVLINFANGATGTHNMVGGSSEPMRRIHIVGTKGEILRVILKNQNSMFQQLTHHLMHTTGECQIEEVDLNVNGDMVGAYAATMAEMKSLRKTL